MSKFYYNTKKYSFRVYLFLKSRRWGGKNEWNWNVVARSWSWRWRCPMRKWWTRINFLFTTLKHESCLVFLGTYGIFAHVCVWVWKRKRLCVYVCVREREREKQSVCVNVCLKFVPQLSLSRLFLNVSIFSTCQNI